MHKNFYLFEQLVKEIKPSILGAQVIESFTYQKDELSLRLDNQRLLRFSVSPDHPYILLSEDKTVRQPALQLFQELEGQHILDIRMRPFDKHAIIEFENLSLQALFYAPYFNIFLTDKNDAIIGKFKEKSEYPQVSDRTSRQVSLSIASSQVFRTLIDSNPHEKIFSFFKKNLAALNNLMLNELFFRLSLEKDRLIGQLNDEERQHLIETLQEIHQELNAGQAYLYFRDNQVERIALFRLHHLENTSEFRFEIFDSINKALTIFFRELTAKQEVFKLRTLCQHALQKRMRYLQNSLQKLEENADLEKRKKEAELKGNLLLTFKTSIPKGANEVELQNIFSEAQEKIKIKLNPAKSVAENAQKYFNKFKKLSEEKRLHGIRQDTYQKELEEIQGLPKQLEKLNDLMRLKKFAQKLKEMKILQKDVSRNEHKIPAAHLKYSFRRLILDKKWDVYIGKDGPNNELLTFRFANKWDIWLHAQGVAGSHVIIHLPSRNQMPPKHIIEQAAQIAAANSKAKHASTVPVMYTQVRYVSRIRKAPPGTVKVQNEKIIFVKPLEIK